MAELEPYGVIMNGRDQDGLHPGAVGADEDGKPRMVTTPWFPEEIPMTEAAELGTKKVMEEHSTIGILVTTDGTITDIPRADYVDAEWIITGKLYNMYNRKDLW